MDISNSPPEENTIARRLTSFRNMENYSFAGNLNGKVMLLLFISHVVTLMNKEPFVKVIENNVVVKKHIAIRVTFFFNSGVITLELH